MLQYSPKIVQDSLVMCLDASQNKSYPTDLPVKNGLVMWMDAADDTTFSYSSGSIVSQWRDKSGYNYHMVPKVNGPTRSVFLNSRKVLAFTAVQTIGNDVIDLSSTTSTVFVVSRYTSGTNQRVLTCNLDSGGGNWLLGHWGGYVNQYYAEGWVSYQVYGNDTVWRMYMGDYSGVNTDLANIYSNGTAIITNSTAASGGLRKLGINYYSNETSTCEVAEIIVFNRVLSATESKLVHTYLGQKWGISNTDRSVVDLSGFDDNGLLGDGTTANMPAFDYYNKGSLKFDGSNDYINIGNPSSVNFGNGDFTIEMWMTRNTNATTNLRVLGKGADSDAAGSAGYAFFGSDGGINFGVNPGAARTIISAATYSLGEWFHVVGVVQRGSTMRTYKNGVLVSSAAAPTGSVSNASINLNIGRSAESASLYWPGNIAIVRMYNKALSVNEVLQNYEAQKTRFINYIATNGLVLNLDAGNIYSYGGAGTTFYDVSPTALSWTINNATYNSSDPKYFSYNGSNSWLESSTSAAYDSQTITMECWFYPTTLAQNGFLFEKGQVNAQYSMFLAFGNTFYFRTIGGTINNQDLTFASSTYLTANAWNHVVCTYNGSIKIIYVNGVQAASVNASGTLQTGQTNQYIGKYGAATNNFPFNGRIGESRVYNIALSAAQVLQNYNATKGRFGL